MILTLAVLTSVLEVSILWFNDNCGNDKYIETKIKMYEDRVNTNFQGKKVPKENASYKCLSLIMSDSVIRVNKKYYPQTFGRV